MMSERSQLTLFENESDGLTSSPADSPARMSPLLARVPGSEEHAPVSGSTWRGSSPECVRRGYSLRTFLLCGLEALTEFSLTWRRSNTTYGRWWWVLGRPERRTEGIGSGSWPTAKTTDWKDGRRGSDPRHGRQLPEEAKAWQTPSVADVMGGHLSRSGERKNELLLRGQVKAEWATPQAHDATPGDPARVGRYGTAHGGRNLNDEAAQWPTPASRDWKGDESAPAAANRHSPCLPSAAFNAGLPDPVTPNTIGKPRGSLNSAWVAQLMGLPADWCDLPDGVIETLSRRSGTASSRKSSK